MIYLITIFVVLFFILAWRRLDLAVMFLIAAMPTYLIRFSVLGLPATLLEAMIWAVFLVWAIKNFSRVKNNFLENFKKENRKIKIRYPFDWEIVLLLIVALAAASVAGFSSSSLGIFKAYFFEPALFFIVVFNVMNGEKGREKILWALAASALAVSLLAIYQKITGQLIDNNLWAAADTRRVVSFFGYPNAVGLYLGPIVLVITGWLFTVIARCGNPFLSSSGDPALDAGESPGIQKGETQINLDSRLRGNDKREKVARNDIIVIIFISLTIILSLLSIYFAKSKGALMGVAAGLVIFGLLAGKKIRCTTIIALILISAGIAAYQSARDLAVKNITLTNLSGQIRKAGWADTWAMLKDGRVLTGAGLANYQASVAPYHTEGIFYKDFSDPDAQRKLVFNEAYRTAHWQPLEIYLYPHNIFLNFWSELGLAGLLLFAWVIIKYFWLGIKILSLRAAGKSEAISGRPVREIAKLVLSEAKDPRSPEYGLLAMTDKYLNIGLICAMVVIVAHGLVDVPYFKNDLAVMFWLLIAMMSMIKLESVNSPR
ncbi:MAG: O-antigen ligase family protein [Candidatus Falkowbacteria bacterium]